MENTFKIDTTTIKEMIANKKIYDLDEVELRKVINSLINQMDQDSPSTEETQLILSCLDALAPMYQHIAINEKRIHKHILKPYVKAQNTSRSKKRIPFTLVAIIIILMCITIAVYASGILNVALKWGKEQLSAKVTTTDTISAITSEPKQLNSIEDIRQQYPQIKIPSYIPADMNLCNIQTETLNGLEQLIIEFSSQSDRNVTMIVSIYNNDITEDNEIEIDHAYSEEYISDGISYYIETNIAEVNIFWTDCNSGYLLMGNLSVEEMKKIIDSL